jgi:hypothetical protein
MPIAGEETRFEKRAVAAARSVPVSELDPKLPKIAFDRWLARTAGAGASIDWETNDCGEQTGNPRVDGGRDFPICVEATATLPDHRVVTVAMHVGTVRKGIVRPIAIRYITLRTAAGVENIRYLRELNATR